MTVTFVFRHLSGSTDRIALEEHLAELASSFERYFAEVRGVRWTVSEDAGRLEVACEVEARRRGYRAVGTHSDAAAAANLAFEKLVKQRRRAKKQGIGGRRGDLARGRASPTLASRVPGAGDDG